MEQSQVDSIYKNKILPRKIFGMINALISLFILFFFIGIIFTRCGAGKFEQKVNVTVLPLPLNEMEAIKDKTKREQYRKAFFEKYAKKVTIKNSKDMYRLRLRVARLPLNRPRYVEIAFEVYNNESEYLFTFYADNFWHQSGYDDGYWHQWNYIETVDVKFPYNGEYYFVAAIGKNRNFRAMYQAVRQSSGGQISVSLYKGIKPISIGAFIFAFFVFLIFTIILFAIASGAKSKAGLIYPKTNIDFEKNHYIAKFPPTISKKPFYVSGYQKCKNKRNVVEYILTQDSVNYFLEIEQEIEFDEGSKKTFYYSYFYKMLPESDFQNVPEQSTILFDDKNFKDISKFTTPQKYQIVYSNGLSEEIKKTVKDYGVQNEDYYISFEWMDSKDNFDASYGAAVKGFKIWEVKKDEGDN